VTGRPIASYLSALSAREELTRKHNAERAAADRAVMAALRRVVGPTWQVNECGRTAMLYRKGLSVYRYPVHLEYDFTPGAPAWLAYSEYAARPSDRCGSGERVTNSGSGNTPPDALDALAKVATAMARRARDPDVVADLRHLAEWVGVVARKMRELLAVPE
jgi:hypothetical protein